MSPFSADQKIAMLVVPMLLFGMLGVSYASAAGRSFTEDEESTLRRAHASLGSNGSPSASDSLLKVAIQNRDYDAFVLALQNTPFYESATQSVFDTLVRMYELHTTSKHDAADAYLQNAIHQNDSRG